MTEENENQEAAQPEVIEEVTGQELGSVQAAAVDPATRTIKGVIITFNEVGTPSTGLTKFEAGSIETPAELDRVKLLVNHDSQAKAVGYLTALEEDGAKLIGTFKIAPGAEGDQAIKDAKEKQRDGLSVGVERAQYVWAENGRVMVIKKAFLREVSLVTTPAYVNAKVTEVKAAKRSNNKMNAEVIEEVKAEAAATPSAEPVQQAAPVQVQAAAITPQPVVNELGLTAGASLHAVADAMAANVRAGGDLVNIAAALNTLTPKVDPGQEFLKPQWIAEVWQAGRTGRPFFDGAARKEAITTGLKVQGFKRDLTQVPAVLAYEGNGKPVTSKGGIATVPVEADIVRRAGAWQIDRALVDLGSGTFISSLLTAAAEEYARETEAYAVSTLLKEATEVEAATNFAGTLAKLGVASTQLGAQLSTVQMSSDMWLEFAELNADSVPWWLKNQGELNLGTTQGNAGKLSFSVNHDLPAGTLLAADSRAYTTFERKNIIDVQAVNIGNGAIEVGVYGYVSMIVNDARAVLRVGGDQPEVSSS